ncbi:MAG: 2-C-methyl-D-erythritol 2,4-cyclodiphosphate synthase [Verrucomicrobia bacterium GWC2_42_7]|nr:MAG: 2-C-methyl-D-erythritol 2,4-cyclodiphosphate synthase [Verrucomicrobia bacterium GWC2_42_7]
MKIGFGYDIHRLVEGRQLVLGGVKIAYSMGLEGHSDADCLTHALADAILGALGLPDIGHYFPPSNQEIKGIDSQIILAKAVEEATSAGYILGNVDITVVAEHPKIAPYIPEMKKKLSEPLLIPPNCIGIKATTNEKIGDIGKGLAIAAYATCLLMRKT